MGSFTRRQFLKAAGVTAAAAGLGSSRRVFAKPRSKPSNSGFNHVIVVMMENRSFDHFMGWMPGTNGQQAGLSYLDKNGIAVPTFPLAPNFQGCNFPGPVNSFEAGRMQYDNGACDGWLFDRDSQAGDVFPVGYYTQPDLAFLGQAAPQWTLSDSYFAAIMAETWPNRLYQHCGVTDRLVNDMTTLCTLPTIWDRLAQKGLTGRYYFSDLPFLGLFGPKYAGITRTIDQFYADCASGDLPHVAFVDPRMFGESEGGSGDDHPFADIRAGEYFLSQVYKAVTTSDAWKHTVMIINFDEWGGFFDHVAPAVVNDVNPDYQLRGFRVPMLIVSPFARRGYIANQAAYDHTSVLKMIEWRWNLEPLSVRDAEAANLAVELDFTTQDLSAPEITAPPFLSVPCAL